MKIALSRSDNPRVSIIIPSSIRTDLLYGCLHSLMRFSPRKIPYETIVVFNEADVGAEARLRETVSGVEFMSSPVNLGLAGAGNRGRSLACGEFLLLLHDDAEVLPGWMEALVETADSHPEAGAIGSKVLFHDDRLQNVGSILWRNALTSPRWVGDAPPPSTFDRLEIADYCGTVSLLVRASAWDTIGGLDEQFYPAYYVDVDLSMSLRRIGYVVLCQPNSQIHHHRNASTSLRFRHFICARNREHFEKKWAAALEQQEPFESNSPAAIERAVARAQALGEQCRTSGFAMTPTTQPRPFDPVLQENEHYAKARALQKGFIEYLGNIVDEIEADRVGLRELATTLSRQNQELEQAHSALLRSWIWRMSAPLRYLAGLFKVRLR
jgi:GT2 family glycosyltransferase